MLDLWRRIAFLSNLTFIGLFKSVVAENIIPERHDDPDEGLRRLALFLAIPVTIFNYLVMEDVFVVHQYREVPTYVFWHVADEEFEIRQLFGLLIDLF